MANSVIDHKVVDVTASRFIQKIKLSRMCIRLEGLVNLMASHPLKGNMVLSNDRFFGGT